MSPEIPDPQPAPGDRAPATAVELAGRVHSGRTTASDLATAALAAARADADLGAFVAVDGAGARAAAARIDALDPARRGRLPLAGVPVAVKDNVAADAPVIRRLLAAGAVAVGRTATPELCTWPTTDSEDRGITRNPWDRSRTAGGSSGGSAAAVAAGIVPLAHGNDGAGSLRIPAACCGLVTIKPGRGVVPTELPPDDWGAMAEDGPLATTVGDVALALAVMADRADLARPGDAAGVRVGTTTAGPLRVAGRDVARVAPAWRRAVTESAEGLCSAGLQVVPATGPVLEDPLLPLARWTSAVAREARHANLPLSAMERRNRHHALLGRTVFRGADPAREGGRWNRARDRLRTAAETTLDAAGVEVLMTPTLADVPPAAVDWHLRSWGRNVAASARYAPLCVVWNLLGWPAMSVPAGVTTVGNGVRLPVAVQLVARPGGEARLLAVAAVLESVRPWRRTA